jgi:hypothetical protein
MMTVDEASQLICDELGKTDSDTIAICKRIYRRNYSWLWDAYVWKDTLQVYSISTSSQTIILPNHLERAVAVSIGSNAALPIGLDRIINVNPSNFATLGTPTRFYELEPVAVNVLPTSSTILKISSSSAADVAFDVLIRGFINGVEQKETITLNGTNVVSGVSSWDTPTVIAKDVTTGTVTVTDSIGTVLQTLWPEERTRQQSRIMLWQSPNASVDVLILCKKKLREMTDDNDTPTIRNCDNALIALTKMRMLKRAKQYGKAGVEKQEAVESLSIMRDLEKNQSSDVVQLEPISLGEWNVNDLVFGSGIFSKGDF